MKKFIIERCGIEAKNLIATGRQHQQQPQSAPKSQPNRLLKQIYHFLRYPSPRVADQEPDKEDTAQVGR